MAQAKQARQLDHRSASPDAFGSALARLILPTTAIVVARVLLALTTAIFGFISPPSIAVLGESRFPMQSFKLQGESLRLGMLPANLTTV